MVTLTVLSDDERNLDRALLGKLRAYLQLMVDDGSANPHPHSATHSTHADVPPECRAYRVRALREWKWLREQYQAQQLRLAGQWRLLPLALLDPRRDRFY